MFPKSPGSEDTKGIKPFPEMFLKSSRSLSPPIRKGTPPWWRQSYQIKRLQNGTPKLSCEHTGDEEVLDCFILLITEGTMFRMRQPSFLQAVRSPAAILDCQPNKGFALPRCPGLPYLLPWFKRDGPNKVISISWSCGEDPRSFRSPDMDVICIEQVNTIYFHQTKKR